MSIFEPLFSPIGKWRENPKREKVQEQQSQELHTTDKVETVSAEGIDEISISSNTNIIITKTNNSEITVRIHGTTSNNYEMDAYVTKIDKMIYINARGNAKFESFQDNHRQKRPHEEREPKKTHAFANITLEVEIPVSLTLKKIKVKNSNGNIIYKVENNVELIEISNKNGNVDIISTFKNLKIDLSEGNINVKCNAKSDLNVEIICSQGTVYLSTKNIKNTFVKYQIEGSATITPDFFGEYNIYGEVHVNQGMFIYR